MNWEAIGAAGELLGAVAVVMTLVYLATQVRQNTNAMNVAAKQEMTRQFSDFCDMLLGHDELLDVHTKGVMAAEVNEREAQKFNILMLKAFWYFSSMHYQYEVHSLDEEEWHQSREMIANYCARPGTRDWWAQNKQNFSSSFIYFIDFLIAERGV